MSDESEVVADGGEVPLGTADAGAKLFQDNFVTPPVKESQHTPVAGSELEQPTEPAP